jgi:hypothetical protein
MMVNGIINSRTVTVKKMIAKPKLLNSILSNKTSEFTIGPITNRSNFKTEIAITATPRMIIILLEKNALISTPLPSLLRYTTIDCGQQC